MRRKEIFSIRIIRVISSVLLRLTGITPVYIRAFLPWKCRYFFPRIPLVLMLKLESLLSRVIIARSKLHSIDRRSFDRILLERFTCHACLLSLSLSLSLSLRSVRIAGETRDGHLPRHLRKEISFPHRATSALEYRRFPVATCYRALEYCPRGDPRAGAIYARGRANKGICHTRP